MLQSPMAHINYSQKSEMMKIPQKFLQNFKYFTEAKMAKQHFQLIADIISKLDISTVIKKEVASAFADGLEATNPMFKRDVFIKVTKKKAAADDDEMMNQIQSKWNDIRSR